MRNDSTTREHSLSSLLITLLALVMIASPLLQWWGQEDSPWYLPYLLWGSMITLIVLLQRRHNHGGP